MYDKKKLNNFLNFIIYNIVYIHVYCFLTFLYKILKF